MNLPSPLTPLAGASGFGRGMVYISSQQVQYLVGEKKPKYLVNIQTFWAEGKLSLQIILLIVCKKLNQLQACYCTYSTGHEPKEPAKDLCALSVTHKGHRSPCAHSSSGALPFFL